MTGRSRQGRGGGGGRARAGLPRSHSSSRNVPYTTSPSSYSQPASTSHPTTSGTQFADQFQFVPRTGQTGFQGEDPAHQQFPAQQQEWDPFPDGHVEGGYDLTDFDFVAETQGGQEGEGAQGQQEAAQPSVTIRTLLETEGRAERLIVLNPDPDAPPHTRWQGRDKGSWISRRITQLLHKGFDGPYYSWTKFPEHKKDQLLYDFAQWYHWDVNLHHGAVVNMVNAVGLERLKDLIYNVRKDRATERPPWITSDSLWQTMNRHWDSESTKKRSETYSQNRLSTRDGYGVAKHFGGSKSFDQYETDMTAEAGRPVGVHEVFRRTHFKDGKYADALAEKVIKTYEEQRELRQSQADPEVTSDGRSVVPPLTQEQDDEIFIQASTSLRPGPRPYGVPKRRALDAGASSSTTPSGWTAMAEKVAQVEERNAKLEEEMRHITERRQQDEQAMAQIKILLAHPDFQRLAANLAAQQQPPNPPQQPSDASQDPANPQNPPQQP